MEVSVTRRSGAWAAGLLWMVGCIDGLKGGPGSPYEPEPVDGCTYQIDYDIGGDGTVDYRYYYAYDEDERLVASTYDRDDDGSYAYETNEYDANDCVTSYTTETMDGGDAWYYYSYDAVCDDVGGQISRYGETGVAAAAIHDLNHEFLNVYAADLLVQVDADSTLDGVPYEAWTNVYTYSGGLIEDAARYEDSTLLNATTYTWLDEDHLSTAHWVNYEDSTTSDQVWDYDSFLRPIIYEYTSTIPGDTEYRVEQTWDDEAYRVLRWTWDAEIDGEIDQEWNATCTSDWPWTCEVEVDGSQTGDVSAPHDGVVDDRYTATWTCAD